MIRQLCEVCKKAFQDNAKVVPVLRYVKNERRGDFVNAANPIAYIHLHHLKEESS